MKKHKTKQPGRKTIKKQSSKKHRKVVRVGITCMTVLFVLAVILIWAFLAMHTAGRQQLMQDRVGSADTMKMSEYHPQDGKSEGEKPDESDEESGAEKAAETGAESETGKNEEGKAGQEEKEGRVYYHGKAYDFNEDILTFLIMGIDQRSETVQEYTEGFEGGSADAIFLLILNPHNKKMQILAIDRNTMTDVDVYDYYGEYTKTVTAQICVQHGFGDGTTKSAAYMEQAVSNLLFGLPMNGYCAVNMSSITRINDAVGGVDVVVLEDMTRWDKTLVKGKKVHLTGNSAVTYVRERNTDAFGSAAGRLERQKQYINALIQKAKSELKGNPALPLVLFRELSPYMVTDLNAEKVTYLATMAAGFDFGSMNVYKVPGETVMGDVYEEFYADQDALYELILELFYEEAAE